MTRLVARLAVALAVLALAAACGANAEQPPTPMPNAVAYLAPGDQGAGPLELFIAIEDGAPQQLTDVSGRVSGPTWSPDGSRLAYTVCTDSERPPCELYTMNADGSSERALGEGSSAYWSPDGTRLAYLVPHGEHNSIYVTDATRYDPRLKTRSIEEETFGHPSMSAVPGAYTDPWSPDGRFLAFTRVSSVAAGTIGRGEVFTVRADATDETRITSEVQDAWFIGWSPDGTQLLVYASTGAEPASLYLVGSDGGGFRSLLGMQLDAAVHPMAAWSPEGARVAFAAGDSIYVVRADGVDLERLTEGECDGSMGLDWSPDGTKLGFVRGCSTAEASRLLSVDLATGIEQALTTAPAIAFAWSPAH